MNKINFDFISQFEKTQYRDIVNAKVKIAEDVMNNTFLFDMPHDLERTTTPVHFDEKIDWEYILNGDKEFAYQLTRHRFCIDLAEAYHLTQNEAFAKRIVDILTDFIKRAPYRKDSLAWRTLETGLRGEYWTRTIALIRDSKYVTDEFLNLYKTSLDVHAKLLIDNKIDHHKLSNWGVLQDHGLFAIGIELDNDEYKRIALERLYEEANLQLMADGVHWEVSTTYHNEVLQCFLDTMIRARENNISLDSTFIENVRKMAYVDVAWIKPNHNGPLYGDSDVTDLRGILSVAALMLGDGVLEGIAGDVLEYDVAWRVGEDGIKEYASIEAISPDFKSIELSDSGNYIMRSGFGEDDNYLIFHNSNTGGGHAHEDKLSFELSIGGKDVLVDTGRYSYVWNNERKTLKSYKAHNTSCVDNSHFIKAFGWDYIGNIAPSIRENMIISDKYELVRGAHIGYVGRFRGSITTSRSILWLKDDVYIVIDEFFGKGKHMYANYWNFAPNTKLRISGNVATAINDDVKTNIFFMTPNAKLTREVGLYSHHYNSIQNIDRIKAEIKGKANAHMITVIVGNTDKHPNVTVTEMPVTDAYKNKMKDATALEIKIDGKTYTFIATFKEHIRLLLANGKPATGKFTLYEDEKYNTIKW